MNTDAFRRRILSTLLSITLLAVMPAGPMSTALADTTPPGAPPPSEVAFDPVGDWLGALEIPTGSLRLIFHITRSDEGLSATVDSVDQGANGIPVTTVTFTDGKLDAKIEETFSPVALEKITSWILSKTQARSSSGGR